MKNGSGALAPHSKKKQEITSYYQDKNKGEAEASLPIYSMIKTRTPKYNHLPHIDLQGHYQFITFRTFDSVDEFIRKLDNSVAILNKKKQLKIDEYLDHSLNGAYLQNDVLSYLYEFLIVYDKKLYELVAFSIMNNHVHILLKPLESLRKVMQILKGASAKRINEILGKNGKFWADDYYDKAIRDEKHFSIVYEYIKNNPLKIGEAEASLPRFYGIYE
jgi:putative transposase